MRACGPPMSVPLAPLLFVMQQLDPGEDGEQRRSWGAEATPPLRDAAAGSRGDGEEQRRSWGAEGASGSAPPPRDAAAGGQEETAKSRKGCGEEQGHG